MGDSTSCIVRREMRERIKVVGLGLLVILLHTSRSFAAQDYVYSEHSEQTIFFYGPPSTAYSPANSGDGGNDHWDAIGYKDSNNVTSIATVGEYPGSVNPDGDADGNVVRIFNVSTGVESLLDLPDDFVGYRNTTIPDPVNTGNFQIIVGSAPFSDKVGVFNATTQEFWVEQDEEEKNVRVRDVAGFKLTTETGSGPVTEYGVFYSYKDKVGYRTESGVSVSAYVTLPAIDGVDNPHTENVAGNDLGDLLVTVADSTGPTEHLFYKPLTGALDEVLLTSLVGSNIASVISYADVELDGLLGTDAYNFRVTFLGTKIGDAVPGVFLARVNSSLTTLLDLEYFGLFDGFGGSDLHPGVPFSQSTGGGYLPPTGTTVIPELPSNLIGMIGFLMGGLILWMRKKSAVVKA